MEQYIYLTVRLIVIAWVLYRLWQWVHTGPLARLWDKIIPRREPKPTAEKTQIHTSKEPVVGATHVVVLEDPHAEAAPVAHSTELKETGYIGKDDDISPDDVETNYQPSQAPAKPTPEELYDDQDGSYGPDPRMSSGMSFESIGDAVTVLVTDEKDEQRRSRAAQTFHDLQNTPLYDFITREISSTIALDSLVKEYFTEQGELIVRKADSLDDVRIRDFDLSLYV